MRGHHRTWTTLRAITTRTTFQNSPPQTLRTSTPRRVSAHGGCGRVDSETSGSGGPQIAVALERAADESVVVKVAVGGVGTGGGSEDSDDAVGAAQVRNADGSDGGKGKSGRHSFKVANRRSPYEMHRSRGALMSVSDLVGPAWYVLVFFGDERF